MDRKAVRQGLHKKDPRCHWCKRRTIEGATGNPLMATLFNLYPSGHPYHTKHSRRRAGGFQRGSLLYVLACLECSRRRVSERDTCLACDDPILAGEFHPCERPENCTDGDCPIGATMVGWPHPIEEGCSCFSSEGPTGCMDDGAELSRALCGVTQRDLNRILAKSLYEPERETET